MAATPLDRETILKAVQKLPPEEQLQVAQQIMKTYLAGSRLSPQSQPAPWVSWRILAGIALGSSQTPPTESQIAEWLDERRMKEAD
ncbi:MAG TPA: hypothetical protein VFS83_03380 [Ktedonobacterales bacterium]|nr:hypothetical protein [Ktedonobacterales bacterium]